MATRKENIDIEYDEPQQKAVSGAAESNGPYESQDPADWVPPMTVRIYPISKPRSKLLATASVNIAKFFFFMFHRSPFFVSFSFAGLILPGGCLKDASELFAKCEFPLFSGAKNRASQGEKRGFPCSHIGKPKARSPAPA